MVVDSLKALDPKLPIREVDVALGGEIAPAPARVLVRPGVLEPTDGRSREPAGVLAKQSDERLLEIAGRDALEVENRDQHFEALRTARIGGKIAPAAAAHDRSDCRRGG